MKTFKAYKKNHTSHRHLTNAFESLQEQQQQQQQEQQQQQQQPYILTDAMNAEIYTQSTSREIMVNLGIVNDTEANQSKLIHRQLTKTATNILPLMMPSSSPSLLSSLLLPSSSSSSSSSSSEAVALTKSALSGESNKLKEMPRNQRCHLKNTDKQMFTMNPALLSTDISCQKTNSTPPSSLTLSSLPAPSPSPLTITSFAYDEVDLVRATATSKALASTTTSATTNSSSHYNTVSLLSSFLTSFSTFSKRKKPNAAFFFTHHRLASNSKTAVTWLLSLLCLVALFGCGHAGFACLSNPCVFGVCIDGLNRSISSIALKFYPPGTFVQEQDQCRNYVPNPRYEVIVTENHVDGHLPATCLMNTEDFKRATSYSCYCIDGYTGIQCQTNWDECWSGPCQNGGTCIDGVAYYNCTCPDGFSDIASAANARSIGLKYDRGLTLQIAKTP
uniref:EGF-like domain-containing protein n=1 Tax=Glossina austeni TaxID=7395 RepID=A0A1A9VUZ7_GLOAU